MTYDFRRGSTRQTYPDGRLVPVAGEEVYKAVRGFMGTGASIKGIVQRGGTRVKVTGGSAMIGEIPTGKTVKLDSGWTVIDDPAIRAKEEVRKLEKLERDNQLSLNNAAGQLAVEHEARRRNLKPCTPHNTTEGDQIVRLWSDFSFGHGDPSKIHDETAIVVSTTPRYLETDDGRTWPYDGCFLRS